MNARSIRWLAPQTHSYGPPTRWYTLMALGVLATAGACSSDDTTGEMQDASTLGDAAVDQFARVDSGGDVVSENEASSDVATKDAPADTAASVTPFTNLPALGLAQVATGLESPLFVTAPRGDKHRLFVVEQGGKVRVLQDGSLLAEPFLDLSASIVAAGEQGLLGLAFHPSFLTNRRFFISHTNSDGDLVIRELVASMSNPNRADLTVAPVEILKVAHPNYPNQNGGMLAFGPDDVLFVGTGDGGGKGDPQNRVQNPATRLGKILRIDVSAAPAKPAAGNLVDGAADPYVWDLGLRNPWRFSFDRQTSDLYIGDVGQIDTEEVDIEAKGDGRRNYGWNLMEGNHCYDRDAGCKTEGLTLPVVTHDHPEMSSITGGYVYRGMQIPALGGVYLYADFSSSQLWALQWAQGRLMHGPARVNVTSPALMSISSFGEDDDGELYVCSYKDGRVYRVVSASALDAGQDAPDASPDASLVDAGDSSRD